MKIRAIFRKHFNQSGEGDDYPTDYFHPTVPLLDMTFVEMRPPTTYADVPCDDCRFPAIRGHRAADGNEYAYCTDHDGKVENEEASWDLAPVGLLDEEVGYGERGVGVRDRPA